MAQRRHPARARVAQWAGSGVVVLFAACARCVDGRLPALKRRFEAAGEPSEVPGAD
ncbi:integrase [Streptomyces viridosporus]|uniref:integrase n=1 Tax=Streptomyces viridosporus TaxID=67581 RepID=UPI0036F99B17